MPRGQYERKPKVVVEPVVDKPVDIIPEVIPVEVKAEPTFDALKKTGFLIPAPPTWQNKKNHKVVSVWSARHLEGKSEVYNGKELVRTYELEVHGENFAQMADGLVNKKNTLSE